MKWEKEMLKKNKKSTVVVKLQRLKWIRNIVQVVCFILVPSLFSQAFGGMKELAGKLGAGDVLVWSAFVQKLVVLCILTMIIGRFFCGWLCAFGALGDWIYQFSKFIQKKTGHRFPEIPDKFVHIFQKVKYFILLVVLLICFWGQSALVTKYSPWTVFSLLTAKQWQIGGYVVAIVLLIFILVGMALQERFFCQFLCPMGAVFSLLPEIPFFKLKRKSEKCIPNCQACRKNCPVKIKLNEDPLHEGECIRCGRCKQMCPRNNVKIVHKKKIMQQ